MISLLKPVTTNKFFYYFLAIIILASCTQKPVEGVVYEDFKNDLETFKFQGKVKKVVTKNADFESSSSDKLEPAILAKVQEFSADGFLLNSEVYDYKGELDKKTVYDYDDENKLTKKYVVSPGDEIFKTETEMLLRIAESKDQRSRTYEVFTDSVLDYTMTYFDDEHDNVKRAIRSYKETTLEETYKNIYVNDNKLALRLKIQETKSDDTLSKFVYDDKKRLVEETMYLSFTQYKEEYTYEGDMLVQQKTYRVNKAGDAYDISIQKFNEYYHPIYKSFDNKKTVTEDKFEYEYDTKGNWIKKTKYYKSFLDKAGDFTRTSVILRDITYYDE